MSIFPQLIFSFLLRSYEGTLDGDMSGPGDQYYWGAGAPLAQGERGSMASLDSTLRKGPGPGPGGWRQPELPEVIAMLNYRLDPVRSNAAAYLQHLTYKNDKVRSASVYVYGLYRIQCDLDWTLTQGHLMGSAEVRAPSLMTKDDESCVFYA